MVENFLRKYLREQLHGANLSFTQVDFCLFREKEAFFDENVFNDTTSAAITVGLNFVHMNIGQ